MNKETWSTYDKLIVDDGTNYVNVGHIFRGDKDVCLENFGEQDEECIKHNAKPTNKTTK